MKNSRIDRSSIVSTNRRQGVAFGADHAAALFTNLLTALIASKGIANVPAGGMVALATVLSSVGLPVEAIAIIAGVLDPQPSALEPCTSEKIPA